MSAALRLCVGLALALLAVPAHALEIPELRAHVVDRAELLPADREAALEARLQRFETEKGTQVVVHTTPSLEGLDIETYSIRIAEAWKIGRAKLDDGVIVTVAPNERKVRIEVGYGLEGAIPDALASRITQEEILPAFRSGRFAAGIESGIDAILRLAAGESLPAPERALPGSRRFLALGHLLFLGFVVFMILLAQSSGSGPRGRRSGYGPWGSGRRSSGGWGGLGGLGGLGGGGFGGGGFGGGGGRFGGGGASGGW